MTELETLTQKIDETRITCPEREKGVTIRGSPFTCDFDEPVDPVVFCEDVTTAEEPWEMFGVRNQIDDDYWRVSGVLYHVEDDEIVDSSKLDFEVCPDWVRVYVKGDCSAERAAEFVQTLDDEYGVDVKFVDDETTSPK